MGSKQDGVEKDRQFLRGSYGERPPRWGLDRDRAEKGGDGRLERGR